MATLFKRIDPAPRGLLAVERVALIYSLLTTVLIAVLYPRMDHPLRMVVERAVIAVGTLALAGLHRLWPVRALQLLRVAAQVVLLSYWYPDTYEFNRCLPNLDHVFASAEQWVFGTQPAVEFARLLPQQWVSELLNMGYAFYYPMMLIILLWFFVRKFHRFERAAFVLVASFFVYYVVFVFVPVAGPQFYFPAIGMDRVAQGIFPAIGDYFNLHPDLPADANGGHGLFYSLVEATQRVGERPTAAFPSSHVGVSTILMILSWRGGARRFFWLLMPFYVLLCLATVYIQAHYLIDAIAGLVTAPLVYLLTDWIYRRGFCRTVAV